MQILIAPNAFKNSLPAQDVAAALHEGLLQSGLNSEIIRCPVGDGGDGTGTLLCNYMGAEIITCETEDPLGRPITAGYGWIAKNKTAIIELAAASGLRLLQIHEYDPLHATTAGTGKMIKGALDKGAATIILCIGGSATVDGGAGIMKSLGLVFLNKEVQHIDDIPAGLSSLNYIDTRNLDDRLEQTNIVILCDVKNTLLGEKGAAAVFGPQKGANIDDVIILEAGLRQLDTIVAATTGIQINELPFSGAAGGVATLLTAFGKATAVNGIDYFLDCIKFNEQLQKANCVITGEGTIDEQTLEGKAPFGVALAAKKLQLPVIGIAGAIPMDTVPALHEYFDVLLPINHTAMALKEALSLTRKNIIRTGYTIGKMLLMHKTMFEK